MTDYDPVVDTGKPPEFHEPGPWKCACTQCKADAAFSHATGWKSDKALAGHGARLRWVGAPESDPGSIDPLYVYAQIGRADMLALLHVILITTGACRSKRTSLADHELYVREHAEDLCYAPSDPLPCANKKAWKWGVR